MPPSDAAKLVLAIALVAAMVVSVCARAPRRAVPGADLGRLVASALGLYVVGAIASLTHHSTLAGIVYAAGIATCTLAAWLSRGQDSDDPPGGEEPVDEQPPPDPDGLPTFDWSVFEADFRAYASRSGREPVGVE